MKRLNQISILKRRKEIAKQLYKAEKWWVALNNCKLTILEMIKEFEGTEIASDLIKVMNWLNTIEQEVLKLRKK